MVRVTVLSGCDECRRETNHNINRQPGHFHRAPTPKPVSVGRPFIFLTHVLHATSKRKARNCVDGKMFCRDGISSERNGGMNWMDGAG